MGKGLHVDVIRGREPVAQVDLLLGPNAKVRFGREPLLNDVTLESPHVSGYHALVAYEEGRLLLHDLGSRNGTSAGTTGARLPPNEPIDLAPHSNQFVIGDLTITVRLTEVSDAHSDDNAGRSTITGKLLQTARVGAAETIARSVEANAVAGELELPFEQYRQGWATFIAALSQRIATLTPKVRAEVLKQVAERHRAIVNEPEFQQLAEQYGVATNDQREAKRALEVLQELAEVFLDKPLRTEAEISAFGKKMRQTLEAFITTFIPLRNGLRTFERQHVHGVRRADPLETASTLAEVAALLLDWTASREGDLRAIFADLLAHQVSMLTGVMEGVRALLDDLSPEKIASDLLEGKRRAPAGAVEFGPFRVWALWREFKVRHSDYADEETPRYRMVFGPAFADAYLKYTEAFSDAYAASQSDVAEPTAAGTEGKLPKQSTVDAHAPSSAAPLLKTPENHGRPKPKIGPTGTMVAGRVPKPQPNIEPMDRRPPPPASKGSRDDELKLPSVVLSTPASSKRK